VLINIGPSLESVPESPLNPDPLPPDQNQNPQLPSTGSRWCASARRRSSTLSAACAPHARSLFCHSKWPRLRADGRRLRRRLVSPTVRRHQIDISLAACFVDAMSSAPSAQRAVVQFYLKQGLVQAAARVSSHGQVQVEETPLVTRVPGARALGSDTPSFASASRRTVVTLGEAAVGFRRSLRS